MGVTGEIKEPKVYEGIEFACDNCPFGITDSDVAKCYRDCGDKPNECYDCNNQKVYLKSEADPYIASLKGEIEKLKRDLENAQASMYCDVVDQGMLAFHSMRALNNLRLAYAEFRLTCEKCMHASPSHPMIKRLTLIRDKLKEKHHKTREAEGNKI